ncbi:MAG: DUF177 domain-containing protein [Flavobacteriales bacterium]|nr:DUF177 domain-containing protein [Flavobacteriales bacterium]MCC6939176.1 DUF177 domain-containing protein [Flavobacteriales bacterium]
MEALTEHTIPFTGLSDGPHEFRFELGTPFFEAAGEEEFEGGEVSVLVKLDKTPTMLVTHIHVEGPVQVLCDHCNTSMDLALSGDQRQIFQLFGEADVEDDELVVLDPRAHSFNLTHYIYECLRLSLPARHVHPEGQCDPEVEKVLEKLNPEHSAEWRTDPRWEVLQQLKTKRP